jgi:hypothetical protein
MKYCNKTGTTYIPSPDIPVGLLPTKNGYEQFTIRPAKADLSWVAVNNKISKRASGNG